MRKMLLTVFFAGFAAFAFSQENSVSASTLAYQLSWLRDNAADNIHYIIGIHNDETIVSQTLPIGRSNTTITLRGSDGVRTISLSGAGSLFTVDSGVTLRLDSGIILKGNEYSSQDYLIRVNDGGTLIMNGGKILNHETARGGGVFVAGSGTFTIHEGAITVLSPVPPPRQVQPVPQYQAQPQYQPEPQYLAQPPYQPEPQYLAQPPYQPEPQYLAQPPYQPEPQYLAEPKYRPEPQYLAQPPYQPEPQYLAEPKYQPEPQYLAQPPYQPEPQYLAEPKYQPEPQYLAKPPYQPEPQYLAKPPYQPEPQYLAQPPYQPEPQYLAQPPYQPEPQYLVQPPYQPEPQYLAQPPYQPEPQYLAQPQPQPEPQVQPPQRVRPEPQQQVHVPPPEPPRMLPPAVIVAGLIPEAGSTHLYRIQVGAFEIPWNAVQAFNRLRDSGLDPRYERYGRAYRVVLPWLRADQIQEVRQTLGNAGFREVIIRQETGY